MHLLVIMQQGYLERWRGDVANCRVESRMTLLQLHMEIAAHGIC